MGGSDRTFVYSGLQHVATGGFYVASIFYGVSGEFCECHVDFLLLK